MSDDAAIRVEHVSKEYRLGMIGGTTLRADLQRLWAKVRGQEDPTAKIGTDQTRIGEKFLALDDVSFEVKKGEVLGIIGHNGAGKSTLLKLLARVTAPTKGKISYNGRIASMLEVGTGFHGELTGRENIYMNGAILGMTKREITRKLDEIIAFAEMEKFIDTPVKRYSSGMYVKLAFSVAAHLDAEIMIMDEVLAVGDMKFQKKCLSRMNEASHNEGRTVLFVSHNMGAVKRLCSTGLLLQLGKINYFGEIASVVDLYCKSAHAFEAEKDLLLRTERTGEQKIRFKAIQFFNQSDIQVSQIISGESLKVKIFLEHAEEYDYKQLIPEVCLCDSMGEPICQFIGDEIKTDLHNSCEHVIWLDWEKTMLRPGCYYVRLVISYRDTSHVQDRIDNACILTILEPADRHSVRTGTRPIFYNARFFN